MSNPRGNNQRSLLVIVEKADFAYLLDHMLTDELRIKFRGNGASTVARKIIKDAIAAHKNEASALKARLAAGGVDRRRLMGRR